ARFSSFLYFSWSGIMDPIHNMFGATNDRNYIDIVNKWKEDAIADGWSVKPTYGESESVYRSATLEKEGFKALVLTRIKEQGHFKYEANIWVYGPDRLAIEIDLSKGYNWQHIVDGLR